jgi:hypothetical protein
MLSVRPTSSILPRLANTAVGSLLPAIQDLVSQVLESRQRKAQLHRAILNHEAESLVTGEASTPGPGRRSRRSDHQGPENRRDLSLRPPTSNIPRLPANVGNQVCWDTVKIRATFTTLTSGPAENNFAVSLNSHPQVSSWAALFDQFCIPQFSVSFFSQESPSSTGSPIELHTAIDFDNVTNIGTLAAIDDFGSAQVDNLIFNKRVTRSIKPCVKFTAGATASSGVARSWIDCATPGVNHFGIRSICAPSVTSAQTFVSETTIWFGFRNSI